MGHIRYIGLKSLHCIPQPFFLLQILLREQITIKDFTQIGKIGTAFRSHRHSNLQYEHTCQIARLHFELRPMFELSELWKYTCGINFRAILMLSASINCNSKKNQGYRKVKSEINQASVMVDMY